MRDIRRREEAGFPVFDALFDPRHDGARAWLTSHDQRKGGQKIGNRGKNIFLGDAFRTCRLQGLGQYVDEAAMGVICCILLNPAFQILCSSEGCTKNGSESQGGERALGVPRRATGEAGSRSDSRSANDRWSGAVCIPRTE